MSKRPLLLAALTCSLLASNAMAFRRVNDGGSGLTSSQSGVMLSGFSASNYLTATGTVPSFGPGHSIAILYRMASNPNVTATLAQNADASHGWQVQIDNTGQVILNLLGSSSWSTGAASSLGFNALVITWDNATTNTIRASASGATIVSEASPSYVAPGGSSINRIGVNGAGSAIWPDGVLEVKEYASILSDADIYAIASMGSDNRFSLLASSTQESHVTVDWKATQWNGSSSTVVTGGSSPVTYSVAGTPILSGVSECVWDARSMSAYYWDSYYNVAADSSDAKRRNVYDRLVFSSTDPSITVDITAGTLTSSHPEPFLPLFTSSGTYITQAVGTSQNVRRAFLTPLGGNANVELWDGVQGQFTSSATMTGSYIRAIRASTCSAITFTQPSKPANRVVVYGDSISNGMVGTVAARDGWVPLLRNANRASWALTLDGWASRALGLDQSLIGLSAVAANLVAEANNVQAGGQKVIIIALGVNDYGSGACGAPCENAATYGTYYGQLEDAIHSRCSDCEVFAFTATSLTSEGANALGSTLPNYRTQAANACNARSSYCTVIDGSTILNTGTDLNADGVHPNTAGHAKIKAAVAAALGML